jgi:hypothetical protein
MSRPIQLRVSTAIRGPLDGIDDVLVAVQRQRLPDRAERISCSSGCGLRSSSSVAGIRHPGGAEAALEAVVLPERVLDGRQSPHALPNPSTVVTSLPSA